MIFEYGFTAKWLELLKQRRKVAIEITSILVRDGGEIERAIAALAGGQADRATARRQGEGRGGVDPMSRGPQTTYKPSDLANALKAMVAAGLSVARIEIQGGKIIVFSGKPAQDSVPEETSDDIRRLL
jgi:hypothetical protein